MCNPKAAHTGDHAPTIDGGFPIATYKGVTSSQTSSAYTLWSFPRPQGHVKLAQNYIQLAKYSGESSMAFPGLPFYEGMSTLNKPSWDNHVEADRSGFMKRTAIHGRIVLQQWDRVEIQHNTLSKPPLME